MEQCGGDMGEAEGVEEEETARADQEIGDPGKETARADQEIGDPGKFGPVTFFPPGWRVQSSQFWVSRSP